MTHQILFCFIAAFQISIVLCRNGAYQQYFSRHDKDPCETNPCQNGGTCIIAEPVHKMIVCNCAPEYYGYRCEKRLPFFETTSISPNADPCNPNPCKNGGVCNIINGKMDCTCPPRYYGLRCEYDFLVTKTDPVVQDSCNPNPCKNGGICSIIRGKVDCTCPPGYYGLRCDYDFPVKENDPVTQGADPCYPGVCENGGTCIVTNIEYMLIECECTPEFYGYRCEQRLPLIDTSSIGSTADPCASNPCKNGGTCWTLMGDVTCDCSIDYYGTRCEKDFNSLSAFPPSAIAGIVVSAVVFIILISLRCYYYQKFKGYWSRLIIVVTPRREPFEQDHQEGNLPDLPPPYDTVPVQQQNHAPSK